MDGLIAAAFQQADRRANYDISPRAHCGGLPGKRDDKNAGQQPVGTGTAAMRAGITERLS